MMRVQRRLLSHLAVLGLGLLVFPENAVGQKIHFSCPRAGFTEITAQQVVMYLTHPALKGRAFGGHGESCASGLVAALFQRLELAPVASEDFFHPVASEDAVEDARNVVGVLPGGDSELGHEYIVIGAHHDHIGARGQTVFPGADDNASGVAALLLTAQTLARQEPLRRSVLFVTFSGEETGFHGSRRFMSAPPVPLDDIVAMVNLDMVGRLRTGGLILDGWDHLPAGFQRTFSRERVRVRPKGTPGANSDGRLFRWAGIPVVTFFTGFHPDYHRPTDTLNRLDLRGIETIARLVEQLVTEWAASDPPS